jgi:hypothetical protein
MRTLYLVGIAAVAAWASTSAQAQSYGATQHRDARVIVVSPGAGEDAEVYRSADDRVLSEGDYRGRWDGQWNGQWDNSGSVYRGTYQGEYDGRPGVTYDADRVEQPRSHGRRARHSETREYRRDRSNERYDDRYDARPVRYSDADLERACRPGDRVAGAAVGGAVGALAGNRIAGRGNRLAGSLIGGGVGALAGMAIDGAIDRRACDEYLARTGGGYRDGGYRDDGYRGGGSYGYQDGYVADGSYGYIPGATTTVIYPGQPTIIEETETIYETVTVAPPRARHAPRRRVHRVAPRPRPRCTCR